MLPALPDAYQKPFSNPTEPAMSGHFCVRTHGNHDIFWGCCLEFHAAPRIRIQSGHDDDGRQRPAHGLHRMVDDDEHRAWRQHDASADDQQLCIIWQPDHPRRDGRDHSNRHHGR
ncbi:hypothetical protein BVI434_450122 [Burkholderia vietnamiensis]|nr:hypothetical protein BVI434_450122 [Burkholderia vietnamiensis]